jgi:hypothetical protein
MAMTRGSLTQLHDNTDRMIFVMLGKQLKELPDIWRQVTKVQTSDRMTEISMNIVGFGDVPEKGEGNPYTTDILMPGPEKRVTHTEFGMAFEVTQTALEDDRYDQLKKYAMWLAFSAGYVLEKRGANLFNNGFSTETTADGLSIFNTGHTLVRGGTFRNRPSTDVNLSWDSLKDAIVDLATETKHDSGQIALATQNVVLYVPPQLEMLADRIVNSNGLPGSADNDRNAIKSRRDIKIVVNPLLTDTNAWFVLSANKDMHGIKAYERVPITQESPTTDPRTRSRLYPVRFRYSFYADIAQNSWGTQGA